MNSSSRGGFFTFHKMITPAVITVVFWIGIVAVLIAGIVMIVMGATQPRAELVLMGVGYLILGPIAVRVYCEMIVVIFRINDTLTDIKNSLSR